jgi:transposase InsO family protein
VAILHELFTQHGVPETIASDKGTQFTSHEFMVSVILKKSVTFCRHTYQPKSKGRAERFFHTFKRGLLKLWESENVYDILNTFLLAYRTTPSNTIRKRQTAELFFGLKTRTTLDLLLPSKEAT